MTKRLEKSLFFSGAVALSVIVLNVLTTRYPWCLYPIFGILWWPLSAYFAGKKQPLLFAVCGTALLWSFFLTIYLVNTPGAYPWFLFPVLGTGWWPLSVWGAAVGAKRFSVTATLYLILMLFVINLLSSPHYWWWIYPSIFVVWWPVSQYLSDRNHKEGDQE